MKNFLRALKNAWPYRRRLVLSIVCALFAAALWSANFTAIYPILQVFGTGDNLQSWVDSSIKKLEKDIRPLDEDLAKLKKKDAEAEDDEKQGEDRARVRRQLAGDICRVESKLSVLQGDVHRFHVAKRYLDRYCPSDRFETLLVVMLGVVIATVLRGFFEFFQESFVGAVVNHSLFDLRHRLFRKVLHLDIQHFSEAGTHDLTTRLTNDIDALGGGMRTIFGKVIAEPLKALACITMAAWFNWQLTLMCLIIVPFALLVLTRVGRTMKRATRRLLEGMGSIYKILHESFLGIRIIKAFAREPRERRRFRKVTREYLQKAMWVVNLDALTSPIIEVLTVIAVAAVFLVGAYIALKTPTHILGIPISDQLDPPMLMQLFVLLAAAADPVRRLSNVYTRIQAGWAGADRIYGYIDKEPKIQPNTDGPTLERHHRDVEFRNVCFSYVPGQVLLEGVDLHIKHGEVIAIVGKNGCGKTSLLNLLPRFYDSDHGSILIDGHDIRAVNLRSLRKQIAIVTQDSFLFDDTVSNNIAYAKPGATREEIEAAAAKAQAHDFIVNDLGQGYDSIVGTSGGKLSGGQRQRICLARAFLADPSILILDEFTNQNDPEAELDVHRTLQEFRKGRTIFLITHRLHTLEIADRIVVLDEGRVAACGTHAELLRTCPVYQRLHDVQQQRLVA